MKRFVATLMLLSGLLVAAGGATASVTYNATWSGGGATATGTIVFSNDSVLTSGTSCTTFASCNITSVAVTVSGAGAGNGSFTTADFDSNPVLVFALLGPLNTSADLVGQANLQDFNLFNAAGSPTAPSGAGPFVLAANGGLSTSMTLISLVAASPAPTAQAVPSLSEWAQLMLALMVISMLGWQWRKQQN